MTKLLKVELHPEDGSPIRTSTIDLASGGFAILAPRGLPLGSAMNFTLHVPGFQGSTPISGSVVVASCRRQGPSFRVSFRFDALSPEDREVLDLALIDAVLERFTMI